MRVRLTDLQKSVVQHREGALLVEAGPGSGKTRVLTERIRVLLSEPGEHFRVLALTFTNKAANEMKERLVDVEEIQRAFVGTLHSFCMEVLANRGGPVGIDGLPNIFESFDDRLQILSDAVRGLPHFQEQLEELEDSRKQNQMLRSWLERISEIKGSLIPLDFLDDDSEQELVEAYDGQLRTCDAIDYDDLLVLTHRLFQSRPKTADFYRRQYRYICIDEAQDLNEAQFRLLCELCGDEYKNVMMVGDPKQAIYVWNGADPKYMAQFADQFDAKVIKLTENFRCSRQVVSAAQRLEPAYKIAGQLAIEGLVEAVECTDESEEASYVADTLQRLCREGHPDVEAAIAPASCAVLARNKFVFSSIRSEFKERDIPFYIKVSSSSYRSESPELRDFELALRILANPADRLHRDQLAKSWGLSQATLGGLLAGSEVVEDQFNRMANASKTERATTVIESLTALGWQPEQMRLAQALKVFESKSRSLRDEERALVLQDVLEWRKHWDYFVRNQNPSGRTIGSFLANVALGTTQQPREDGVALLTVHSAKGMEFDVVFLVGMNEGTFPDYRATGKALLEERRSAFVAVTRSKRLLFISYPRAKRMPWGDVKPQRPSRFLRDMLDED